MASQLKCSGFTDLLDARGITQSMSRKGNWPVLPAESFFKTLKAELPVDLTTCSYPRVPGVIQLYQNLV